MSTNPRTSSQNLTDSLTLLHTKETWFRESKGIGIAEAEDSDPLSIIPMSLKHSLEQGKCCVNVLCCVVLMKGCKCGYIKVRGVQFCAQFTDKMTREIICSHLISDNINNHLYFSLSHCPTMPLIVLQNVQILKMKQSKLQKNTFLVSSQIQIYLLSIFSLPHYFSNTIKLFTITQLLNFHSTNPYLNFLDFRFKIQKMKRQVGAFMLNEMKRCI